MRKPGQPRLAAAEKDQAKPVPAFWDVVRGHMDEQGIETLEELHERFLETEWAERIPVPARHRGSKPKLPEFKRHVTGSYPALYGALTRGLEEVFEISDEQEVARLTLSYIMGRPRAGVRPETPLP